MSSSKFGLTASSFFAPLQKVERHGPGNGVRHPRQQPALGKQRLVERNQRREAQIRRGGEISGFRLIQQKQRNDGQADHQRQAQSQSQFHGAMKLSSVPAETSDNGRRVRGPGDEA